MDLNLTEEIEIRRIRLEDSAEIGKIQSAITKSPLTIDFRKIIEGQVLKNEEASFVAEIAGRVAGYMISYIMYGGFGLEKIAWIAMMGVDPKFMGMGIGKKLAEEIFRVYTQMGIDRVFTSVRWDSTDHLSFFKTMGFDRSSFINLVKNLT